MRVLYSGPKKCYCYVSMFYHNNNNNQLSLYVLRDAHFHIILRPVAFWASCPRVTLCLLMFNNTKDLQQCVFAIVKG